MKTWIALLRGINVGGKNILAMKDLRKLLTDLGYENVRTYIQSGNCAFQSKTGTAKNIATKIAKSIDDNFGFRPQILVLTAAALKAAIKDNPYKQGNDDPKSVHLGFLYDTAASADLQAMDVLRGANEQYTLTNMVFYLYAPDGVARSKLATQIEKKLGVSVTARNLRSAKKILEMATT